MTWVLKINLEWWSLIASTSTHWAILLAPDLQILLPLCLLHWTTIYIINPATPLVRSLRWFSIYSKKNAKASQTPMGLPLARSHFFSNHPWPSSLLNSAFHFAQLVPGCMVMTFFLNESHLFRDHVPTPAVCYTLPSVPPCLILTFLRPFLNCHFLIRSFLVYSVLNYKSL